MLIPLASIYFGVLGSVLQAECSAEHAGKQVIQVLLNQSGQTAARGALQFGQDDLDALPGGVELQPKHVHLDQIQPPEIFRAMQLKMFKCDTFRRHARMYMEPAIVHKRKAAQDGMLEQLNQRQHVILGGDVRADSPGHSAKFDVEWQNHTMMDLRSSTVMDLQLVQSNEAGGSYHMEKEGLKRSLALLEAIITIT